MVTFYRPQIAQVNKEPPPKSSLDLTLTQHPCDEEPEPQEVRALEPGTIVFLRTFAPW